jgi:hypothetical protein
MPYFIDAIDYMIFNQFVAVIRGKKEIIMKQYNI